MFVSVRVCVCDIPPHWTETADSNGGGCMGHVDGITVDIRPDAGEASIINLTHWPCDQQNAVSQTVIQCSNFRTYPDIQ